MNKNYVSTAFLDCYDIYEIKILLIHSWPTTEKVLACLRFHNYLLYYIIAALKGLTIIKKLLLK